MITACEQAETGSKYLLSGTWITLKYIAQQVSQLTGTQPPGMILPLWLAKTVAPFAAYFDQIRGKRPQFTPISMNELESNPNISHEKASKELGYQPRPIEQTLADTVDWFRSHGFLK